MQKSTLLVLVKVAKQKNVLPQAFPTILCATLVGSVESEYYVFCRVNILIQLLLLQAI